MEEETGILTASLCMYWHNQYQVNDAIFKEIYRFHGVPNKLTTPFFTEIKTCNSKLYVQVQKTP